jgi:hypothetical protein
LISLYVTGTITVTITTTVPCPTSWTTTTQVITTTDCPMCQPQCQSYTTTVCESATTCSWTTTCSTSSTCLVSCSTSSTCVPSAICGLATTCTASVVTSCQNSDPPATGDYYGYTSVQQEQPYTTITSGTIVYVVMPSTGAAAGQETNGIVQIASAAERFRDHDGSLMANSFALAVIMLALMLM